ncbi:hypothetical protein ACKC9G_00715 [Pokkaliibacter sp. CJK22405]|uniref:hypothetical protein n=1 Tax=Pokkaliibacter sp. CJK22405 TaxID=3384615 RepID=UPI003984E0E4
MPSDSVPPTQRHTLRMSFKALLLFFAMLLVTLVNQANAAPEHITRTMIEEKVKGHTYQALYLVPELPKAVLILLSDSKESWPEQTHSSGFPQDDFLLRAQSQWLWRGYAVLIPQVIKGKGDARLLGDDNLTLLDRWIERAHGLSRLPVFLVGHGYGTLSAVNGAAHSPSGSLSGVVLSTPITVNEKHRKTVFNAGVQSVRLPTLIIGNRRDQCPVSPPAMATGIARVMTRASDISLSFVSGGKTLSSDPCHSKTAHGYFGIESRAVGLIDHWVDATLTR